MSDEQEKTQVFEAVPGEIVEVLSLPRTPITRSLKYERLYPLGQYVNVKFVDEIDNLPEEVFLNEELIGKLRYLQMIESETSYRVYLQLYEKVKTMDLEQLATTLSFLEAEKTETLNKIKPILNLKQGE